MNNNQTLQQLRQLKLQGMQQAYEQVLNNPIHLQPEAHDMLAMLTDAETIIRSNRKTQRLTSRSKMRYNALITDIYCSAERNFSTQQLQLLAQCHFIPKKENLIITGATGCGKTYLACAIGQQACQMGYTVHYINLNKFMANINLFKIDGTYNKYIFELSKYKLLILDEFGIAPLNQDSKLALLSILEERYDNVPTIIIGQIPVANWHHYINEPTIADAILDRITANAHRIELKGKSLRNKINN